jgi:SAM-dependent methyltransferase
MEQKSDNLYKDLAEIYEAMYYTFINYEEEHQFYSQIIKANNKQETLEIGSGTGSLATHFVANDFKYFGLDFSADMIEIAQAKLPNTSFRQGDMRNFDWNETFESIIMAGRTISYLVTNKDVNTAFSAIHQHLEKGGIFCFDFIDASRFIPDIIAEKNIVHEASFNEKTYLRKGIWTPHLVDGMDVCWEAEYYEKTGNELTKIGQTTEVVRTFTIHELELFLKINNFKINEIIEKTSYAFPTYVFVAEKI